MWSVDKSGVRHWMGRVALGGTVRDAAAVALSERVDDWPCWFWFAETPAPMAESDTVDTLVYRWIQWRDAYQAGSSHLLDVLLQWSSGE